jgi:hypothetical protein
VVPLVVSLASSSLLAMPTASISGEQTYVDLSELRSGMRVRLTLVDGSQVEGNVVQVEPESVALERLTSASRDTSRVETFARPSISRVEMLPRQGWSLGKKIGVGVAIGAAIWGGLTFACWLNGCFGG